MTDPQLRQLLDREAIRDCLYLYCRGIDRADEAALRASYWPDATDDHGPYKGSASGFIDMAMPRLRRAERSIHEVHNVLIAFEDDGQCARVESQFSAFQREPDANGTMTQWDMKGRYLDRFTKRGDEWRVQSRVVVFDWAELMPLPPGTEAERFGGRTPIGGRFPDDPLYAFLE
ncbi:nuclear transport factor 2 family protein [Sphingomonas sp. GB1N7]|uniref:nuclear transport factor 2 family protein n=1 Tax=Parasphingomonas caseinilytica TaxID=3096158 RepID=UPI002FC590AF